MYLAEIALDHVHVELGVIRVLLPRLDRGHHSEEPGVSIGRKEAVRVVRARMVVEPAGGGLIAGHHGRAEVRLPGRHQRVAPQVAGREVAGPLPREHALQEVIRWLLLLLMGDKCRKSLRI